MDLKEKIKHGTLDFPLEIYHYKSRQPLEIYTHYHKEFELILILSGVGTAFVDNNTYPVSQNDVLFINSQQLHGIAPNNSDESEFIAIVFAPEFYGALDSIYNKYVNPILKNSILIPTLLGKNINLIDKISSLQNIKNNPHYELIIKAKMLEILDILWSTSIKKVVNKDMNIEEIKVAVDYIKEHYKEKITLQNLSNLTNLNRDYFCKKFSQLVGLSPIDYLVHIRIEYSCNMLVNTNLGIGSIAMDCGFSSFSYYSKVFRRIKGCSPKEYRKKDG